MKNEAIEMLPAAVFDNFEESNEQSSDFESLNTNINFNQFEDQHVKDIIEESENKPNINNNNTVIANQQIIHKSEYHNIDDLSNEKLSFDLDVDTASQRLLRWWIHSSITRSFTEYLLNANPKKDNYNRKSAIFSQYFPQGMDWGMHAVWPISIFSIIAHDFIKYATHPDQRFDITPLDILLGTTDNDYFIGNSWGSNLVTNPMYWTGLSLALSAPLLLGLMRWAFKSKIDKISNLEQRNFEQMLKQYQLGRLRWLTVFHNEVSYQSKKNWCDDLLNVTASRFYWQDLRRIRAAGLLWSDLDKYALAKSPKEKPIFANEENGVVGLETNETAALFGNSNQSNELQQILSSQEIEGKVLELQKDILTFLNSKTAANNPKLQRLASSYYLWSLGKTNSRINHAVWTSLRLLRDGLLSFSAARIMFSIFQKINIAYNYYLSALVCAGNGMEYAFMAEWGDYHCAACPELEYVYFSDRDSFSACLEGIFRYENDSSIIIDRMSNYLPHIQAPSIDLSQQMWYGWGYDVWNQFLDTIEQNTSQLSTLNLSQFLTLIVAPSAELIDRLGEFLNGMVTQAVNIQNLNLGTSEINQLVSYQNNNTQTTLFNLRGNHIYGDGLVNFLQVYRNVTNLDVTDNNLNGYDLTLLADYVQLNPSLRVLKIGNNSYDPDDFIYFLCALANSQVEYLDISNTALTEVDFSQAPELANSKLSTLIVNGCKLIDDQMQGFRAILPPSIKSISLVNNYIGDNGINHLFSNVNETSLAEVDFSYNQVTGRGLLDIQQELAYSDQPIKIYASYNPVAQEDFIDFLQLSADTPITTLGARGLGLDDDTGEVVAELIDGVYGNSTLVNFDFGQNSLTGSSAQKIIYAAANGEQSISFQADNNLIDSTIVDALIDTNLENIHELDLSYCPIYDADSLKQLFKLAAQSKADNLKFDGITAIDDMVATNLARHMISFTDQANRLGDRSISREEAKAVNNAVSKTSLKYISLSDTSVTETSQRFFCRIAKPVGSNPQNYNFANNPAIKTDYCQISSGVSSRQPQGIAPALILVGFEFMPIILCFAALYVLYRGITAAKEQVQENFNGLKTENNVLKK